MTEESAVKVCVRVRPLIRREEADNAEPVQLYWKADKQAIHQLDDDGNMTKSFSFDRVFSADETTNQLYHDIAKPLVVSTVEGYNGTIFAYGQTSSGKTFSMMGSEHNPGVIPLAMADVFHTIKNCPKKEFLLRVSYMEIYNETVTDLLVDSWKRKPLEIREGNYKNVYVADLTEELVTSPEQALSWIRKGEKNRHYGKTKMNQRSSRSHTIFRMILESRERSDPASGENVDSAIIVSHLNLVDLAGAERASQTGAEGARLKEGCNINRSLFTLGQVIKKLSDESQKGFTNYRDSKLTRILQNSLGGNAKTVIICTITPATVDETVSTLQFASAAKRMKNDPHVTEVSDEGALLRRYRNEIVDLKRRLLEVSSITQTTETEKETLFQLIQEKDQLQREQADRITNLTKLLVTASNVVPVPKIPKRRVTWGGKHFRSSSSGEDYGSPDLSFAEPFFKKRKADLTVTEETEDMEEFDTTPCFFPPAEDTSLDLEMNQSNVTMRSSAEGMCTDSPQLLFRVECLARQLETESQEKQKAEEKSATLEQRTAELEKLLQNLEQQLKTEVQEKEAAEQKCSMLELRVTELEKSLEPEKDSKDCKQYLAEAVQFCHTLSSEREVIAVERDELRQNLEKLAQDIEQLNQDNKALLKDKETLLKEIEERKEAAEFEKLEEESKKDYEQELEAEISALKSSATNAEDLVQKLKSELEVMSAELKKKSDLVADLQSLNGKDLVQEVTRLRRSLDDAEGLSLETKKEWAFLRSENLSLKERDETLTVQYNQMENEVKSLQSQLEHEKCRFKKMQADLQKELHGAFDENTKLTALLDGKVPKNVLDNLTLEKTVAELRKELEKSQESEKALQSKIEELKTLEGFPAKVDDLLRQVCELTGELYSVQEERDNLVSAQAASNEDSERLKGEAVRVQEEVEKLQKDLADAELKKVQLNQQHTEVTEQLAKVQADLQRLLEENRSLLSALEEMELKSVQLGEEMETLHREKEKHLSELTAMSEERNQLQEVIHAKDSEHAEKVQNLQVELQTMIENQEELRAALEKAKVQKDTILQLEAEKAQLESKLSNPVESSLVEELQVQVSQLKEALQSACTERDTIACEKALDAELEKMQTNIRALTEEREQLQEMVQGLRDEKSQLKRELEEKDELILQVQSELNKKQPSDLNCVLDEENEVQLQQTQSLEQETEELSQENSRLRTQLQDMTDKVGELSGTLDAVRDENVELLAARMESQMIDSQLKEAEISQQHTETSQQLEKVQADLQHFTVENNKLLASLEEANQRTTMMDEELLSLHLEREQLLGETSERPQDHEELESLRAMVTSVTEERNQLQEILQSLREECSQLKIDLEESNDMLIQEQERLKQNEVSSQQEATCVQDEVQQHLQEQLSALSEENQQLKMDAQENVEMMIETQAELRSALANVKELEKNVRELEVQKTQLESQLSQTDGGEKTKLVEDLRNRIAQLLEELQIAAAERDKLLSEKTKDSVEDLVLETTHVSVSALSEERDQLLEIMSEEKNRMFSELEEKNHREIQLLEENKQLKTELEETIEKVMQLKQDFQCASNEKDRLLAENAKCNLENVDMLERHQASITSLTEERDQLVEVLQAVREEKNQLKSDLEMKEETIQQLKALEAEREPLSSCNSVNEDGDSLQELLQGVREMQALKDELESLRQERTLLRCDLQEAAETSKAYQNLLHSTREELKQLQNANSKAQSAEQETLLQQQMSQMNADLSYLREQLLEKKTSETQSLSTELQNLLTRIAALEEEKAKLQELLEAARQEEANLRRDLQESEQMKHKLEEELESFSGIKEQLLSEKTHADQLQEVFHDMTHIEEKVQELEKEKMQLESEVSSLSQSVYEMNEQTNGANDERLKVMSEIVTCNEKLKVVFLKLQAIIDRPKPKDYLADGNSKENVLFCQLLPFVPIPHRTVFACLTSKTARLDNLLRKNEVTLQKLATLHKAHFMKQVHRDVASFEERRLHDMLIRHAQEPSQTLQMLPGDFQEIWDQRLLELLDKRRQYLQNMNDILEFLEDGVAKHAVMRSEELHARTRANEESRSLAGTANTAAIVQFFERELTRRSALAERQRVFHQSVLDKFSSASSVLKPLEEESIQRLKEERSESLALLPSPGSEKAKTEAELLQDKQRLFLQLQKTQKNLEVLQMKVEEMQAQTDMFNRKHVAELEELSSTLQEKQDLIQNLQVKLKESEALAKVKMPPSASELEAMKDKLVKMEFDHIAVTTSHEKEIGQLKSVVEHRGEVIRKLKETLRKTQHQDEQSFAEGEEPHSKPGTQAKPSTCHKEKKIEELERKTAQFESLVNKQQEEITKWKTRAYKLRESKKEVPHSPRTPTKRPLLTETEVNSPKISVLDSPKSKFFDVHSGTDPMSLKCPKQFFDNSSLGTMPDAGPSAAVSSTDTNSDNWWNIPTASLKKTDLNVDANGCPTQ
ncbi:Centromere-associated protein E [Bagarius yarrelli]|uniref:Centromere-associated protein E n=1 Tax=Bagarius yarrelli TaxID=175774 RepID=A0A556TKE2_BAGYA|nr:Centromere-associated protein E [Bagarius yarrelli]